MFTALFAFAIAAPAFASESPRTEAPPEAKLYIISPTAGETVKNPVVVRFGLSGMGVAPAGTVVAKTGHHHLLIDTKLPEMGLPIPNDANHVHFGGGQTETTLTLSPGEHTLQLLLGDHSHIPHQQPVVSEQIKIVVE
ncbi:MAG: DUF4399 domain-containing protein [Pseudomarimonas sp.]